MEQLCRAGLVWGWAEVVEDTQYLSLSYLCNHLKYRFQISVWKWWILNSHTFTIPFQLSKSYLNNSISCRSYIFELWTENDKLLGNMDLFTALAAFFHLCFTFDLKYPKVSICPSDWNFMVTWLLSGWTDHQWLDSEESLQVWGRFWYVFWFASLCLVILFAGLFLFAGLCLVILFVGLFLIILFAGTRTWKRRDSAVNKIEHFCSRVYRLTNWCTWTPQYFLPLTHPH